MAFIRIVGRRHAHMKSKATDRVSINDAGAALFLLLRFLDDRIASCGPLQARANPDVCPINRPGDVSICRFGDRPFFYLNCAAAETA